MTRVVAFVTCRLVLTIYFSSFLLPHQSPPTLLIHVPCVHLVTLVLRAEILNDIRNGFFFH